MNVRFSMPRFIGILGEIYSKDEVQKMKEQYEAQLAALKRENEISWHDFFHSEITIVIHLKCTRLVLQVFRSDKS